MVIHNNLAGIIKGKNCKILPLVKCLFISHKCIRNLNRFYPKAVILLFAFKLNLNVINNALGNFLIYTLNKCIIIFIQYNILCSKINKNRKYIYFILLACLLYLHKILHERGMFICIFKNITTIISNFITMLIIIIII